MAIISAKLDETPVICTEGLPCPFCGSQPYIEYWHGGPKRMISCGYCDVSPKVTGKTKAEALRSWNQRA